MSRGAVKPLIVGVLVVVALWKTPGTLDSALSVARSGSSASRTERELVPAHVVGLDETVFPRLAQLMPEHATYSVELSPDAPPSLSAGGYVGSFLNYWLLPRRAVPLSVPHDYTLFIGARPNGGHATNIADGMTLVRNS